MHENFSYLSGGNKVSVLLYYDLRFDVNKNNFILSASITYILGAVNVKIIFPLFSCFRILTGKAHPQIKLQRLQKI